MKLMKQQKFDEAISKIKEEAKQLKESKLDYNTALRVMCRKQSFYTDYRKVWKNPDECLTWILFVTGVVYGVIQDIDVNEVCGK